ncbi:hypothetical protein ZTR_02790 [Talaromyces verruculosus]|nr:hypothetical protein ZTR_02790 [Talaromyces verruculosus]
MRFTAASIVAFAAGALASASSSASVPVVTEVVTSYETYCPEATTFVAGSSTVAVTAPGTVTLTGSYTVTRPLLSSTVTICNSCSSTAVPPLGTGSPNPYSSVVPSPAPPAGKTTSAVSPAFTGGASHAAAGAGAGLAAVFGAAAFLL